MSLIASFMSSVTILGVPAEFYVYGNMFTWFALVYALLPLVIGWVYMPVFYDLGISSSYEVSTKIREARILINVLVHFLLHYWDQKSAFQLAALDFEICCFLRYFFVWFMGRFVGIGYTKTFSSNILIN